MIGLYVVSVLCLIATSSAKEDVHWTMKTQPPCIARAVEPKVKCTKDLMRIEVPTTKSTKSIYLQGLREYPDPACKPQTDDTRSLSIFQLNLTDVYQCGITRVVNQITQKHIYYQTVIVESTAQIEGSSQLEKIEEIYHVKCPSPAAQHSVTKRNVLPAGFQEPEPEELRIIKSYTEHAPVPKLGVGVRQNGNLVLGELNVSPGTPLQMEIFLDQNSSTIYGILVTHMQVTDTKAQEETIIYNGCSVDPYLFENFNTVDGDFLTAKFRAFKFPESTYVQFKGTVNVCLDKCQGVECSDGQIGYGRKRREISSLPADPRQIFVITITSFIKVNGKMNSLEETIRNDTKVHNHKKFIIGDESDKKFYKTIEEAPSNLAITKLTEEEQIISIIGESSSSRNSLAFVIIFVSILRLFL